METIILKFIAGVILFFTLIIGAAASDRSVELTHAINYTEIEACKISKPKISDYTFDELRIIRQGYVKLKELSHYYNNMNFTEYNRDLYNRCLEFNKAINEYFKIDKAYTIALRKERLLNEIINK